MEMDARTIIRAFNSSWATVPSVLSQKKKVLTSPEQRQEGRNSRRAGKWEGIETEWRRSSKRQGKESWGTGGLRGLWCLSQKRHLRERSHLTPIETPGTDYKVREVFEHRASG